MASTTGQGEPPLNMLRFWRFLLRKSLPPDLLAGVGVGVFGLGDSGYPRYNVVSKKVRCRLAHVGGCEWRFGDKAASKGQPHLLQG